MDTFLISSRTCVVTSVWTTTNGELIMEEPQNTAPKIDHTAGRAVCMCATRLLNNWRGAFQLCVMNASASACSASCAGN